MFLGFWLTAQQEYRGIYRPQQVKLSLFFSDSHSIWIKVNSTDPTDVVISKIASALGLPQHFLPYFGLFILEITRQSESKSNGCNGTSVNSNGSNGLKSNNGLTTGLDDDSDEDLDASALKDCTTALITTSPNQIKYVRKLQNFEAPFLTLETMESYIANINFSIGAQKLNDQPTVYTKRLTLTLRKCYWDCNLDCELFKNEVCLNLIYHQAMSDLQQGWIPMTKEVKHQLNNFVRAKSKSDFLNLAKTLKYYSYIHFDNSYSDYLSVISDFNNSQGSNGATVHLFDSNVISDVNGLKRPHSSSSRNDEFTNFTKGRIPVIVSLGGKELLIRPISSMGNCNSNGESHFTGRFHRFSSGEVKNEVSFKLNRIRCWRLTATEVKNSDVNSTCNLQMSNFHNSNQPQHARCFKFELSFEYLLNKTIKSITIESNEAVLMSMCLQGMVNELLSKRHGTKSPFGEDELYTLQRSITASASTGTFIRMDGSKQLITSSIFNPSHPNSIGPSASSSSFCTSVASSSSSSSPSLNTDTNNLESNSSNGRQISGSNVNTNGGNLHGRTSKVLENEAFEGIKDEVV